MSVAASGAFALPQPLAPPPPAPPPARAAGAAARQPLLSGPNFVVGVTNATFHETLARLGSVATAAPLLLVLTGNVTVAPHPGLPRGGFNVTRPVVIMGRDGVTTGLDFGGKVGGRIVCVCDHECACARVCVFERGVCASVCAHAGVYTVCIRGLVHSGGSSSQRQRRTRAWWTAASAVR
jgi:hypothetical protein